jgi:GTP-dependent phosphoenolpyruvate carboxykinase
VRGAWSGCHVYFCYTDLEGTQLHVHVAVTGTDYVVVVSTRKCEMNAVAYFSKMKGFTDEMVATGKPLEDEDFIAHLLAGLDYDYNSFIENISARSDLLTINDVLAR